ncbi:MAG TPA: 5-oxoprolinase subunit PxpB [Thermoanaerobaculia bacterium]|nr:5-oxoprolinase subunit PxpB [Thermoanaerobaculia bacterium]
MTRAEEVRLVDVAEGSILVEYPDVPEEVANRRAVAAARSLATRPPAGFLDAVPGARTLLVEFEPRLLLRTRLAEQLRRGFQESESAAESRRVLELPVCYDTDPEIGPDLAELASGAGLLPLEFARGHAGAEYRAAFLGFAPGFAYLTGLPADLHAPRLSTPRIRVPAGSVGIGGAYTGIYPGGTPGGWRLIGRAPARLFDALQDPPTLLLPGDRVRFRAIGRLEFERRSRIQQAAAPLASSRPLGAGRPLFRVSAPGALTSVQGGPRHGWGMYGVPPGGAMDLEALGSGNALLGNPRVAAALEMTIVGPDLEVLSDAAVVLWGGAILAAVNGRTVATGRVFEIRAGDSLRIGPLRPTARAYLCVDGGLEQPLRAQIPRRLAAGDVVSSSGRPARGEGTHRTGYPARAAGEVVLRVLPGPQLQRFGSEGRATFLRSPFRVSAASDRRGVRLEGLAVANRESPDIPPEGTPLGAIQVPRDGQPIILGPDRPVTGGYAKIANVIAADYPLLARALPGTVLRFAQVTLTEALAALSPEFRMPGPASPE